MGTFRRFQKLFPSFQCGRSGCDMPLMMCFLECGGGGCFRGRVRAELDDLVTPFLCGRSFGEPSQGE